LEWVTPHTFRKTVATLISEPVNSETASQQLGPSSPTTTREFYLARPTIAADVVHVPQSSPTHPAAKTTAIRGE
jgi:integrase